MNSESVIDLAPVFPHHLYYRSLVSLVSDFHGSPAVLINLMSFSAGGWANWWCNLTACACLDVTFWTVSTRGVWSSVTIEVRSCLWLMYLLSNKLFKYQCQCQPESLNICTYKHWTWIESEPNLKNTEMADTKQKPITISWKLSYF